MNVDEYNTCNLDDKKNYCLFVVILQFLYISITYTQLPTKK